MSQDEWQMIKDWWNISIMKDDNSSCIRQKIQEKRWEIKDEWQKTKKW